MKLSTFTAENANDAVRLVQENLGPDAVILSVRKVAGHGFARLLQREQIEVTAGVPESAAPQPVAQPAPPPRHTVPAGMNAYQPFKEEIFEPETPVRAPHRWRSVAWLESLGLLPEYADRLEEKISAGHGPLPPVNPVEEWHWVRDALAAFWRPGRVPEEGTGRPHVFIGPPGTGKSTILSKWLTTEVLR